MLIKYNIMVKIYIIKKVIYIKEINKKQKEIFFILKNNYIQNMKLNKLKNFYKKALKTKNQKLVIIQKPLKY